MRCWFFPFLHYFAHLTGCLCGIRVEFREILSRIPVGFEPRQNQAIARNPGVSVTGPVLVHPSHICQIGESDQGPIARPIRLAIAGASHKSTRISHMQDATQHVFCSHALAAWGMEKTQAAMGHVPLSAVTRAHYTRGSHEDAGSGLFQVTAGP